MPALPSDAPLLLAMSFDEAQYVGGAILLGCWVFPATILAAVVMISQCRQHWPKLPRGMRRSALDYPTSAATRSRCATCRYPLEPYQTRCPECGFPRSTSAQRRCGRRP